MSESISPPVVDEFADVFNTKTAEEVMRENEERASSYSLPYFNLNNDELAVIRFLHCKPLAFFQHRIWDQSLKDGNGSYRVLTCLTKNCPLCKAGDRPTWKSAWFIIHLDHIEKVNGQDTPTPKLKLLVRGVKDSAVLSKKNQRRPLSEVNMEVERIGKGTSTQYLFELTSDTAMPNYQVPDNSKVDLTSPDTIQESLRGLFKPQLEVMNRLANDKMKKAGNQPLSANPVEKPLTEDDIPF